VIDRHIVPSFWLSEFLHSDTAERLGINNTPDAKQLRNIETALAPGMQRVRELLGAPCIISSGLRVRALNDAVRGAATSAHLRGLAADFRAPAFGLPILVCRAILKSDIAFEQLILEGSWIHISFPALGDHAIRQALTATFVRGVARYSRGIA
jgi:hypothetical protein